MKKTNLLLLLGASYGGGVERGVLDFVRDYDKKKFNISVITIRKGNIEKRFRRICKEENVYYKCLNSKGVSLLNIRFLNKFVKEKSIEVMHCRLLLAEIYGYFVKMFNKRIRFITSKHTNDVSKNKKLFALISRFVNRKSDLVIAVSKSIKNYLIKKERIKEDKIKLIYNGINIEDFTKPIDKDKKRKQENLRPEDFVVGIVGRLDPQKDQKSLIKAVSILKKDIPNIKLIIVGIGEMEKELKAYVKSLKLNRIVKFLGYRNDINELYQIMDVFCMPSVFEGFGRTNAEALLSETFVISTNIDGVKEVMRDGKDSILIAPEEVQGIVKSIRWVHDNPEKAKNMAEEGKKHIIQKFDYHKIIREIEETYK